MDPLTQGLAGATLSQSSQNRSHFILAGLFGLVGGMAPDLDVLIRSEEDPLLYLEYHRQFSHSFIFIPLGGFLCAVLLHCLIGRRFALPFAKSFQFCTLGFATHGLLDACTSYGTQLLWPFSDLRVAWNVISIIDPLFTLPILTLVILTVWKGRPIFARCALIWGFFYLGLGFLGNHMALSMAENLASQRGHSPVGLSAKASLGNLLVWKIIYRDDQTYYVDAVRVFPAQKVYEGSTIKALDLKRDLAWLDPESQQARDIERFRWFSDGYLAEAPDKPNRIIDLRYSFIPNEINGLWSIELDPEAGPDEHVAFVTHRNESARRPELLWKMISGNETID